MKKILFVDDEPNVLAAFQRQLRRNCTVVTAASGLEGLAALGDGSDFSVVVADMRMPEMNGIEFLVKVRAVAPDVVRLMLTGNADQATAIEAINEGNVFRFLNKPCPTEKMVDALQVAVRQHELIIAERELLERTLRGSVKVLAEILSLADPILFGHTEALRNDIRLLAEYMKIESVWQLEVAAMLAQIGRVTIPPELALKKRIGHGLTPTEQEMLLKIPQVGCNLIAQIPRLEAVSKIILYQNKHFDGAGFPADKIAGSQIPLGARMLKVLLDLTAFEAEGNSRIAALEKLRVCPGWHDPEILDAVGQCFGIEPKINADGTKTLFAITFAGLRVGQVVASPIQTRDGVLLIGAGNRVTPALFQRLQNFSTLSGIKEPIYVEG
jgi:response regulator RpfG family c-di-GMP phosphodiesterase